MACASANERAEAVLVQPGASDPDPHLDSAPGFACGARDLGCTHSRPKRAATADERAATRRIARRGLDLRDAASGAELLDRDRMRRTRGTRDQPALRSLGRAVCRRSRRARTRRHGAHGGLLRRALRPVSLGSLRRVVLAIELPIRRHGEPVHDVCDANDPRWRQVPRGAHRSRACAQLVRQPGHQRDMA